MGVWQLQSDTSNCRGREKQDRGKGKKDRNRLGRRKIG